jgi:hypothetical protein
LEKFPNISFVQKKNRNIKTNNGATHLYLLKIREKTNVNTTGIETPIKMAIAITRPIGIHIHLISFNPIFRDMGTGTQSLQNPSGQITCPQVPSLNLF